MDHNYMHQQQAYSNVGDQQYYYDEYGNPSHYPAPEQYGQGNIGQNPDYPMYSQGQGGGDANQYTHGQQSQFQVQYPPGESDGGHLSEQQHYEMQQQQQQALQQEQYMLMNQQQGNFQYVDSNFPQQGQQPEQPQHQYSDYDPSMQQYGTDYYPAQGNFPLDYQMLQQQMQYDQNMQMQHDAMMHQYGMTQNQNFQQDMDYAMLNQQQQQQQQQQQEQQSQPKESKAKASKASTKEKKQKDTKKDSKSTKKEKDAENKMLEDQNQNLQDMQNFMNMPPMFGMPSMGMPSLGPMGMMGQNGGLMPDMGIMSGTGMGNLVPPRSGKMPVSNMDFWMYEARRQRLESRYNALRDCIVKDSIAKGKEEPLKSITLDAFRYMCRQECQLFRISRARYKLKKTLCERLYVNNEMIQKLEREKAMIDERIRYRKGYLDYLEEKVTSGKNADEDNDQEKDLKTNPSHPREERRARRKDRSRLYGKENDTTDAVDDNGEQSEKEEINETKLNDNNSNGVNGSVNLAGKWDQIHAELSKLEEGFIAKLNQNLLKLNMTKTQAEKIQKESKRLTEMNKEREKIQNLSDPTSSVHAVNLNSGGTSSNFVVPTRDSDGKKYTKKQQKEMEKVLEEKQNNMTNVKKSARLEAKEHKITFNRTKGLVFRTEGKGWLQPEQHLLLSPLASLPDYALAVYYHAEEEKMSLEGGEEKEVDMPTLIEKGRKKIFSKQFLKWERLRLKIAKQSAALIRIQNKRMFLKQQNDCLRSISNNRKDALQKMRNRRDDLRKGIVRGRGKKIGHLHKTSTHTVANENDANSPENPETGNHMSLPLHSTASTSSQSTNNDEKDEDDVTTGNVNDEDSSMDLDKINDDWKSENKRDKERRVGKRSRSRLMKEINFEDDADEEEQGEDQEDDEMEEGKDGGQEPEEEEDEDEVGEGSRTNLRNRRLGMVKKAAVRSLHHRTRLSKISENPLENKEGNEGKDTEDHENEVESVRSMDNEINNGRSSNSRRTRATSDNTPTAVEESIGRATRRTNRLNRDLSSSGNSNTEDKVSGSASVGNRNLRQRPKLKRGVSGNDETEDDKDGSGEKRRRGESEDLYVNANLISSSTSSLDDSAEDRENQLNSSDASSNKRNKGTSDVEDQEKQTKSGKGNGEEDDDEKGWSNSKTSSRSSSRKSKPRRSLR